MGRDRATQPRREPQDLERRYRDGATRGVSLPSSLYPLGPPALHGCGWRGRQGACDRTVLLQAPARESRSLEAQGWPRPAGHAVSCPALSPLPRAVSVRAFPGQGAGDGAGPRQDSAGIAVPGPAASSLSPRPPSGPRHGRTGRHPETPEPGRLHSIPLLLPCSSHDRRTSPELRGTLFLCTVLRSPSFCCLPSLFFPSFAIKFIMWRKRPALKYKAFCFCTVIFKFLI